ncbi:MAG: hypothetical protein V4584_12100 [Verrucomicrobiota bacterium]
MTASSASLMTRFYYNVKPFVPRSLRWALRRKWSEGIRERSSGVWPINEAAGRTPAGWPGWPDGKRFALVLTHDVESRNGLEKVQSLAELEMGFGVRSSYNFIPQGGYSVPDHLRKWLVGNGFEVGVHDLHHDGKLYRSRSAFKTKAQQINRYLRAWEASGFRSGFMLRQLDWLHDLDVDYDASTFDTDPFEPQADGCRTIFPFFVRNPEREDGSGYVELPYSLPQDSTLFLLLKEKSPDIWLRKLDWIAEHGGLALVNIHPDYMDFDKSDFSSLRYPVSLVEDLLAYVGSRYQGEFWNPLPKDLATWFRQSHGENAFVPEAVAASQEHIPHQ